MGHWDELFNILQVLNPSNSESPFDLDGDDAEVRWDDICYFMDGLK